MKNANYTWLFKQTKLSQHALFITTLSGIVLSIVMIAQAGTLAKIIDLICFHAGKNITHYFLFFLILIFLRALFTFVKEKTAARGAIQIKDQLRKKLFQKSITHNSENAGALSITLIESINALHQFYADYLPQTMIAIIVPIMIIAVTFSQNWLAGIILLITTPLIPLFMILIGMGVEKLNQKNFDALRNMGTHFLDMLQGLPTLSLFNKAEAQTHRIYFSSEQFRLETMKILRVAFLSGAVLELFATLSIAMIAVYLGLVLLGFVHAGLSHHALTLFSALFILLLAPECFAPLRQLGAFYHARAEALASSTQLMQIDLDTHSDLIRSQAQARAQKITIITGPSGSGKTTLLNFIFENAADLNQIAYLQQHTQLFPSTIAHNIAMGLYDISSNKIEAAAKKAGVLDFAPDLNQIIFEHNAGLSGGQIQRIAFARVILKDAPIVLLDEPTNYLDVKTSDIMLNTIAEWKNKKTIFIATHDPRIMSLAERVIAL